MSVFAPKGVDNAADYLYGTSMHYTSLTRENWQQTVRESGVRLEVLAVATGKSYSAVYRYLSGTRRPSDEWIAKCEAALAAYGAGRVA